MPQTFESHPFAPVYDAQCRVLVLGTFPSVKSRENAFYYGHPQNRFWRVMSFAFDEELPADTEAKKALLLRHHIALWDVISGCSITGSADSSIRGAVPNDLGVILSACPISKILLNGKTAEKIYLRYWKALPVPYAALPSTSPANAAWSVQRLTEVWQATLREGTEKR